MTKEEVEQVIKDNHDLIAILNRTIFRCPCCTHLMQAGYICDTCGCDTGLFDDGEYTEEEIKQMKHKK